MTDPNAPRVRVINTLLKNNIVIRRIRNATEAIPNTMRSPINDDLVAIRAIKIDAMINPAITRGSRSCDAAVPVRKVVAALGSAS